jgi:hypothetical protein
MEIWEAKDRIKRNGGHIDEEKKAITVTQCGIRVWAAVDFLVNHCGYHRV